MDNTITINGILAAEPCAWELQNGVLTHFIIYTTNKSPEYISVVSRSICPGKEGDLVHVTGRMRSREYFDGFEMRSIEELAADTVKMVTNTVTKRKQKQNM